jgi:hypothetical protein
LETTLNVKDFVIDIPKTIEQVKTNKRAKSQSQNSYEVVLENNTDFVLNRKTATTDKNLVFLVSQGVFYIKNNKNDDVETLSEQKLRAFFQPIYYDNKKYFTKVQWFSGTPESNITLMMQIVCDETMQKMYQHNIFVKKYQCDNWRNAFNSNIKLFKYCYDKLNNSNFDYILKLATLINDKCDFNNAKMFIDKFAESNVSTGLYHNGYGENDFQLFISLIDKYNLNFSRYLDYITQDLYAQGITSFNSEILRFYRDYLDMQVSLYGRVKEKYPKYLKTEHDIITLKFNTYKKYKQDLLIFNVADRYKDLVFKTSEYSVVLPQSSIDIVDEGINQSHCVASYVDKVAANETLILFMRETNNLDKSLVTIEVKDNTIKQAKGFANRPVTNVEEKFLKQWAKEKKLNYDVK